MKNPTTRFSDRVGHYIKYRPSYPESSMNFLRDELGVRADSTLADIGSGTGIFSELLLRRNCTVFGVEPNDEMRHAAEEILRFYPNFFSVKGTAEATTLAEKSVDFVTTAQAFHWFDIPSAKREFRRILKPDGKTIILWNNRKTDTTPFLTAYEHMLLTHGTDYREVAHTNITNAVLSQFLEGNFGEIIFPNEQIFDFEGIKGRLFSSSYVPPESDPRASALTDELRRIFDKHNENGVVRFEYDTCIYYGRC